MADSEFSQTSQSTQAERLVQLRRDKGMTAEQLAQAMTAAGAKVSRGAISNWERGRSEERRVGKEGRSRRGAGQDWDDEGKHHVRHGGVLARRRVSAGTDHGGE